MAAVVFYDGDVATLTNTFAVSSTPTDPTTVSLAITTPSGTTTTYTYAAAEITRTSAGVYTKSIASPEAGDWTFVWTGTGAAADVVKGSWTAYETTRSYCSLDALKSRLHIALTDTSDDFELLSAIHSTGEQIDEDTGRPFGFGRDASVTTRKYRATSCSSLLVPEGISTLTGLVVATDENADGTFERTLTVDTDFVVEPLNAISDGKPVEEIILADNYSFPVHSNRRAGVSVTARFGWPKVPWAIREAALIGAHRLFKRKETSSGVLGFDGGGVTVRLSAMDPDYARLIQPYIRYAVA